MTLRVYLMPLSTLQILHHLRQTEMYIRCTYEKLKNIEIISSIIQRYLKLFHL